MQVSTVEQNMLQIINPLLGRWPPTTQQSWKTPIYSYIALTLRRSYNEIPNLHLEKVLRSAVKEAEPL